MSPLFPRRRFVARNIYINGKKQSFLQNYKTDLRQIVPPLAARFSGVFAEVEPPGDESENHK